MAQTATVEVRLADSEEIKALLKATEHLVVALREEVGEPFTMAPQTQERLKVLLIEYDEAMAAL